MGLRFNRVMNPLKWKAGSVSNDAMIMVFVDGNLVPARAMAGPCPRRRKGHASGNDLAKRFEANDTAAPG